VRKRKLGCLIVLIIILVAILAAVAAFLVFRRGHSMSRSDAVEMLEDGLSFIQYDGDYGFDEFLEQGGARKDSDVVSFMMKYLGADALTGMSFQDLNFGCSSISVKDEKNEYIFGRNFDWMPCNALIVKTESEGDYVSISTVNLDFIVGIPLASLPKQILAEIVQYAPLDGMNEKGFVVSVNMIQDSDTIDQNTDRPDITTTTAIRLLLNKAASVEEALSILSEYDLHASMNYMVHFAMADTSGRSVVVEYVNNEMVVTETKVVTNFYLAQGEKQGIGTKQSHERYDILTKLLETNPLLGMDDIKNALSSVSKNNFTGFETTEWSIVFNQTTGEVNYYHRENFNNKYTFTLK